MFGIFAQDAGGGLAGDAGALGGAHAAKTHCQGGPQERQTNAAELCDKVSHVNFPP